MLWDLLISNIFFGTCKPRVFRETGHLPTCQLSRCFGLFISDDFSLQKVMALFTYISSSSMVKLSRWAMLRSVCKQKTRSVLFRIFYDAGLGGLKNGTISSCFTFWYDGIFSMMFLFIFQHTSNAPRNNAFGGFKSELLRQTTGARSDVWKVKNACRRLR